MSDSNDTVRNRAGNVIYRAARAPPTVVRRAAQRSPRRRLRVLGTAPPTESPIPPATSWSGSLPRFVTITLTSSAIVAAGMRYGEVAEHLQAAGYALPNLGSLPHISVAGACATGTHGSGDHNGSLATAVTGLRLVTADGELLDVGRDLDPDRFPGMVVNLGALGVVTAVTLRIVPTYQVRQYVYEDLPRKHLAEHLDGLASAYSVSVFTDWGDGPSAGVAEVARRGASTHGGWMPRGPTAPDTHRGHARHPLRHSWGTGPVASAPRTPVSSPRAMETNFRPSTSSIVNTPQRPSRQSTPSGISSRRCSRSQTTHSRRRRPG